MATGKSEVMPQKLNSFTPYFNNMKITLSTPLKVVEIL